MYLFSEISLFLYAPTTEIEVQKLSGRLRIIRTVIAEPLAAERAMRYTYH